MLPIKILWVFIQLLGLSVCGAKILCENGNWGGACAGVPWGNMFNAFSWNQNGWSLGVIFPGSSEKHIVKLMLYKKDNGRQIIEFFGAPESPWPNEYFWFVPEERLQDDNYEVVIHASYDKVDAPTLVLRGDLPPRYTPEEKARKRQEREEMKKEAAAKEKERSTR